MIFLDINTFFSDRGGGLRTYYRAKIDWFARHPEHTYYVVRPGPKYREETLHPNVILVEAYGFRTGEAYRFLLDYFRVARLIRRVQPDVVEAGDPWLTGLGTLLLRHSGLYRGLLSSFYFCDPIRTFLDPLAERPGAFRWLRRGLRNVAGRLFYLMQRRYPLIVTPSRSTEDLLKEVGVKNIARAPLGADAMFFEQEDEPSAAREIRLLYAGRLEIEKGTPLLRDVLPRIMELPGVRLTVIGRGEFEADFAAYEHPRYQFLGYIADRREVARIFRQHDVLLAPGPYETFGLSVLEGLASRLIVIGPDRGGAGEMLQEMGSPFIFPADDAEAFLERIRRAASCDLKEHAARARAAARRYGTWDECFSRLIGMYQEQIAPRPPVARPPSPLRRSGKSTVATGS